MAMKSERESIWIGLLEVSPRENAEAFRENSGAFVNVVTWASDETQFREKAKMVMDKLNLEIMGVEGAEPIANRGVIDNEELKEIAERVRSNPNAIIYGTFHTWREDPI
jgi:hypothetical protein